MTDPNSEVKGSWFVSIQQHYLDTQGERAFERILAAVDPEHREALRHPLPSEWYPEATFHQLLRAMYEVGAGRDPARFDADVRGFSIIGVNRFFRAILSLSTVPFAIRQLPGIGRQLRRNSMTFEVETLPGRSVVTMSNFPWFRDRIYQLTTLVSVRTLAELAGAKNLRAEITKQPANGLEVTLWYD